MLTAELGHARHPYRAALRVRLRPDPPLIHPTPRSSKATVSVIVCFRDAEAHLRQAIESVEAQDHERIELILVDDGSTDSSTQIAQAAASRDPERIQYLDHLGHANLGKSSSRNAGLRAARGDYVVFLDADDLLLRGKLSHQAAILDSDCGVDAVYGRTWYWDDPGEKGHTREWLSRLGVCWDETQEPPELLVRFLDQPGIVPCLCAVMARREALLQLGGFDESLQDLYEDQTLIAKLALIAGFGSMPSPASAIASTTIPRPCWPSGGRVPPVAPEHGPGKYPDWLERYSSQLEAPRSRPLAFALARATRPYRHPRAYRVLAPATHRWQLLSDRVVAYMRPEPVPESGRTTEKGVWDWGDLRRLRPVSREFGYDRGLPVDRYYIESFLEKNRRDISGRTLEIGVDDYTRRFGGERTTRRDVLHVHERNSTATIVGDLADAPQIADATFDCVVVTQRSHLESTTSRAPCPPSPDPPSRRRRARDDPWNHPDSRRTNGMTWSWAFDFACVQLFASLRRTERFPRARGNPLRRGGRLLHGLATTELTPEQLDAEEAASDSSDRPGC